MAQKRKNHQTKLDKAEAMLRQLEEKTARAVKPRLGPHWRDNLFEVMMTRLELAAKDKKFFTSLPGEIGREPATIPKFAKLFTGTMGRLLKLAKAPASPAHVAAFSVLYVHVVSTFLHDETRDHAKTMAALDRDLGLFEQFAGYATCK